MLDKRIVRRTRLRPCTFTAGFSEEQDNRAAVVCNGAEVWIAKRPAGFLSRNAV